MNSAKNNRRLFTIILVLTVILNVGCASGTPAQNKVYASLSEMLNEKACACYKIEAFNASGQCTASGSGFAMIEESLIFTCFHTVEDAACINVIDDNGEVFVTDELVAADEEKDIAIYRLSESTGYKEKISGQYSVLTADTGDCLRGQTVYTVASFGGLTNTVSDGIISGNWEQDGINYLIFTAPIAPGCSGGALLDENGNVIGIICRSYADAQSMNIAIPISYAIELYNEQVNTK